MTEKCPICEQIEKGKHVLFSNESIAVILHPEPSAIGHMLVVPKKHYPIIEQVPDFTMGEMMLVANKSLMALFESIRAEGTNIIIQNGIGAGQKYPHCAIELIPRTQNDGLNLQWKPTQIDPQLMDQAEAQIKERTKIIGEFEKPQEKRQKIEKVEEVKPEEDYLIKQFEKLP